MLVLRISFPDGTLWSCLTYTYNFHAIIRNDHAPYLGHFWTLCVEEQFYLVWPAILLALVNVPAWALAMGLIVVGCTARSILAMAGASDLLLGQGTITNVDNLGVGALLACLGGKIQKFPRAGFGIIGGLAFVVEVAITQFGQGALVANQAPLLMSLGCACLVGWVVVSQSSKAVWILGLQPIAGLGRISYGLYLYQFLPLPILYKLVSITGTEGLFADPVIFTCVMILSVWTVSVASWFLLERPLLRLKDHFNYSASPRVTSALKTPRDHDSYA
jgi:peptidoglycan/LPS O-acetylase OafA/YrhL